MHAHQIVIVCMCAAMGTTFDVDDEPDDAEEWALWMERLEHESLLEAVSESRGERAEVGIREEWGNTVHLNRKYDVYEGRRPQMARNDAHEL